MRLRFCGLGLVFSGLAMFVPAMSATNGPTAIPTAKTSPTPSPKPGTPPSAKPSPTPAPVNRAGDPLNFLTPEDEAKYLDAKKKAMATDPKLRSDALALMQENNALHSQPGTPPEEEKAFIEKFLAYQERLRKAMLKQDATLKPVFAQIDTHMPQKRTPVPTPTAAPKVKPAVPVTDAPGR